MKTKLLILSLAFAFFSANAQPKYDTLYNSTIITLTKIGLPPATIISKIQTSITSFDVSTNALIDLSQNSVNGDVINEMIKRNDKANTSAAKQMNSTNPNEMHSPGIYYYNPNESAPLRKLDPSVVSSSKSGGFGTALAQSYSYGIAQSKMKATLAGKLSRLQIKETNPVFYFYFEVNTNPNADSWFFASATSPNEFVLVKLDVNKNSRDMVTGSANYYGSNSGIPNKCKINDWNYEKVADGIYKVTFTKSFSIGEYFWGYASTPPSQYSNNKVFDFGIDK